MSEMAIFRQPPKEFPIADVPGMAKATFFGLLVGYLVLESRATAAR